MGKASKAHMVIRHKAGECIGCCLCAEKIPQYFEMDGDGMAQLLDSTTDRVFQKATVLRMDREEIEEAVEGCPVDIIRLDDH